MQAGQKCFIAICLALESETIQGQTAQKVVAAAKALVQFANLDANALLSSLAPETQSTVRTSFV